MPQPLPTDCQDTACLFPQFPQKYGLTDTVHCSQVYRVREPNSSEELQKLILFTYVSAK